MLVYPDNGIIHRSPLNTEHRRTVSEKSSLYFPVGLLCTQRTLAPLLRMQTNTPNTLSMSLLHLIQSQNTYIYRTERSVWRLPNYWPPTPSPPSECVLPPHQRRGDTHSPGGEGVGGSIFRKTSDIGLASYSIIPLRMQYILTETDYDVELGLFLLGLHL